MNVFEVHGATLLATNADARELWRMHGLDPARPLVVDEAAARRAAGEVEVQSVVTDGDVTTVTRL